AGDWASHNIEHAVSAVHDIPHAGGLAILFPRWMEHVLDEDNAARFARLGTEVFDVEPGESDLETGKRTIQAVRAFFDQ
ncbi:iron-containing alcohol dehydrogenase, partial [Brevibacillus sp. SIMBA_076]